MGMTESGPKAPTLTAAPQNPAPSPSSGAWGASLPAAWQPGGPAQFPHLVHCLPSLPAVSVQPGSPGHVSLSLAASELGGQWGVGGRPLGAK